MTVAINYRNEKNHECGYVLTKRFDKPIELMHMNMKTGDTERKELSDALSIDECITELTTPFQKEKINYRISHNFEQ